MAISTKLAAVMVTLVGVGGSVTFGVGIGSGTTGVDFSPVGLAKAERFLVGGSYGPLKDGELERARAWGAELAALAAPIA